MNALIVKSDGLIYAAELPEEPEKWKEGDSLSYNEAAWHYYNEALASAKESAVLVSDQEKAKAIIKEKFGHDLDQMTINTAGYEYPIPGLQWDVKYDSPLGLIDDSPYVTDKQVAILKESTPSNEQESQEELWNEVEHYIDWPYQEMNVEELMKHFNITRKP